MEAFRRILVATRNGRGPSECFAAYLSSCVRSVIADWARSRAFTGAASDEVEESAYVQDFPDGSGTCQGV